MPDAMLPQKNLESTAAAHPRSLGWLGTTALAMGGSNQSLFLIGALIAGQGQIPGQGSAAIPLLILGLILGWMALPGWIELILMWPNRVGGIAATCAEAFRPYSPVLANLAGTCYWWGWVPTCGLTALLSASAIHQWYLPHIPVPLLASALVLFFMAVNLCGVSWVSRMTIPIACGSAFLAFLSGMIPILFGHVNWHQAVDFHLTTPFSGLFGSVTSCMAGLYLVGFAAPAFEAASCHVGETVNPTRNVPRAMFTAGAMATLYFAVLPVVWLGTLGIAPLAGDLAQTLGPTYAPLLGSGAKAAAIWFMMMNMFHGTIQPLAGAARTLAQLAEDGLLPRVFARRLRTDAPWVATVLTAGMALLFLLAGDPIWLVAAANLTYLIGISLPNVAVWLLRRDEPDRIRPWRAPRGMIELGLAAATAWLVATVLGFEQFGLSTVLAGLGLAYSGSLLYALRRWSDRRQQGKRISLWSLHTKLTGAMILVLALDGMGYLLAIRSIKHGNPVGIAALEDIFVAVALLTISVGLILPGMVAHAAEEVAVAARRLATGTLADFSAAMQALGRGEIDQAHARVDITPIRVRTRDEVAAMAESFNLMQVEIGQAAHGLEGARKGLSEARLALMQQVEELHLAEGRYRSIFNKALEGIYRVTPDGRLLAANPALMRLMGDRCSGELPFGMFSSANYVDPERHALFLSQIQQNESVVGFEYQSYNADGEIIWLSENAWSVRDPEGTLLHYEGMIQDITDRKRLESDRERQLTEALERADHDPLTGLLNHRAFHRRFNEEADRAQREGSFLAVAVLDLDNFKFFNDVYGHSAGDDVLRHVADSLRVHFRSYDTLARFGGDEFALLLPDSLPQTAEALRLDVLSRLKGITYWPDKSPVALPVNLSVGVALFPEDGPTRLEALETADARLCRSKSGGDAEDNIADRLCEQLSHSIEGFTMLNALVTAVNNKDRYTRRHSEDVLGYSLRIAQELALDAATQRNVQIAALLHDVGKIGVPDAVLRKPGNLTDEEFEAVRQHPLMGAIIVGAVPGFEETLDAIRHHHERWDGQGYPFGLHGEEIPLLARLMAVADAYSAMTTDRPYRKGMEPVKALKILRAGSGSQWDPACVAAFERAMDAIMPQTESSAQIKIPAGPK